MEEGLYYTSSENKGADQPCSHCTADLHNCFRTGNNPVFSQSLIAYYYHMQKNFSGSVTTNDNYHQHYMKHRIPDCATDKKLDSTNTEQV